MTGMTQLGGTSLLDLEHFHDSPHSQEPSKPATLLRPGRWRCILLVQSTSIGLWGCTGGRLPLGYHIRRYERCSKSISDRTSAKKFRKGPEGPGTSCNLDFRHP